MLHTQYVFVYGDTYILVINFAPLKSNPGSATGFNQTLILAGLRFQVWKVLSFLQHLIHIKFGFVYRFSQKNKKKVWFW